MTILSTYLLSPLSQSNHTINKNYSIMTKSFKNRISDKVFISFLGSFLIGSWAIIQFVDWIVNRYQYNDAWTDVVLLIVLLLIPGILLVAWRQTAPEGSKGWGVSILSANILLATFISLFGFKSQLSAKSEIVTITNEEGEKIERSIPNQSLTKKMVIFPFVPKGKPLDKWQALGWAKLLALDIEQDNRIFTTDALDLHFKDYVQDYKYDLFDNIPFSVQRKIAQDNLADFWVSCSIGDSLTCNVYSTQDGEPFFHKSYATTDVFKEIDSCTEALENALFNKEVFGDQHQTDLPASELMSSNSVALESFFKARVASLIENDHALAIQILEEAVKIDPNFAMAHAEIGAEHYYSGDGESTLPSFEKAIALIDPLPERQQFAIKSGYFRFSQDVVKLIRLLEMWRKLYPNDYRPYSDLFNYYKGTAQIDKAVAIGEEAVAAGHKGFMLLNLADLNMSLSQFDKAEALLKEYQTVYPHKANNTKELGTLLMKQGKFEEAIAFFEELTILDPSDHSTYLSLANAFKDAGQFKKAESTAKNALRKAGTIQDTLSNYKMMESIWEHQGKMEQAIELMQQRWDLVRTIYPELAVTGEIMLPQTLSRYIKIGRQETAKTLLINGVNKIDNQQVDISCVALINFYMALEDGTAIKQQMEKCGEDVRTTSGDVVYEYAEALQDLYTGNTKKAITKMESFVDAAGIRNSDNGNHLLAEVYRLDGQFEKAISLYKEVVKVKPNDGSVNYDYALSLKEVGKLAEAKKLNAKALDIWKEADANFTGLLDASQLKEALDMQ